MNSDINFKFDLGDVVNINLSYSNTKRSGKVIGRAQILNSRDRYLVREHWEYGKIMEHWWNEEILIKMQPPGPEPV